MLRGTAGVVNSGDHPKPESERHPKAKFLKSLKGVRLCLSGPKSIPHKCLSRVRAGNGASHEILSASGGVVNTTVQ